MDEEDDEIIPVTESEYEDWTELKKQIFTSEFLEFIENLIGNLNDAQMNTVTRIYKKTEEMIKEKLKTSQADSITAFLGIYAFFLSYCDSLKEMMRERQKSK